MSRSALILSFTAIALSACGGREEKTAPQSPPSTVAQAPAPTAPPPQAQAAPPSAPAPFTQEQLRELVAPVALYPDVVLASLLPATTFPDEIRDAAAWLKSQGGEADAPPQDRNWDGSVAALLQFPDVLYWLDENTAWADQVAMAVTYQQTDMLNAVQDFRHQAKAAGNLESNQYQKITEQDPPPAATDGGPALQPVINIEPAQPDVVYVPQYNPTQVVQTVPAAAYPVYPAVSPWLNFGTGMLVGGLGAWAMYSIFDHDDWDDHWHGGNYNGGHNQKINIHDNVIIAGKPGGGGYGPGNRPPNWNQGPNRPRPWNPSDRPGGINNRPGAGGGGVQRPVPYRGTTTKPRPGYAGVQPPNRPGMQRPPSPIATTRPAPRPAGGWTGGERPEAAAQRPGGGGGARPVAKPSAPPQLARDTGARAQGSRGNASLQGGKPSPAARPAAPKQARPQQPRVQQPQVTKMDSRPSQRSGSQRPAMQRSPAPATRQYSQRGNASMGGRGGGGGRRGGGGGRRGR
jgi:hypothetical protein